MKKNVKRTGGRPSREEAGRLPDKIMDAATHLFFHDGYGITSIEAICKRAGISKRTFYHRYADKAAVFKAVVYRVIQQLRPANTETEALFEGKNLEEILLRLAKIILHASISPEALALHRLLLSEATRFPELALIASQQGARHEAVTRIAHILDREFKSQRLSCSNTVFAAEQFLQMVTSLPLRRSLGLGEPMTSQELEVWVIETVQLFLNGCKTRH